ncbi:hypothetical protein CH330_03475 [candidate division WOR-3 bacterium JGI_Cruoil_03_51_56]|uniref:YNCE-like beta-propeller domain-containing protein n=1 Tax=candidate division WOR-3 bacterium JGI_Cruoil_03_51_56 TaxID=1973747 RepID=A0A235BUZ0_UNCW3|nr:MAG: hypothetical protein CH330_03475 [candidate division WOR-3 bacterium JGI_Cruoil_03_51_56]
MTVIDGASNEVVATVRVGDWPCALCYNPQNNKVYCVNGGSNNVTVLDGATNQVVATVEVGDDPWALCYNPAYNKVYSANRWSGDVTVLDGASNEVVATVAVGDDPYAICYNPLDNKVYSANEESDDVTIIDGASNQVVCTIEVGDEPIAFTWNPVQNRTYVANFSSSSISVLRDSTVGIEETMNEERPTMNRLPTIVRGVLHLGAGLGHNPNSPGGIGLCPAPCLLDAAGRKVMELHLGANDIRHLSPGVYFVRREKNNQTTKVVIQR